MQIIRTHTFDSLYHAYRGKEQHHEEECHKQIQTHAQRMLALKRPYFKLKISCRGHAIRLLVKYYNDLDLLIPLLIADKNNRI